MRVLVTGGAGAIGFHMARHLCDMGHSVIICDDLSRGRDDEEFRDLCRHPRVRFQRADLTDPSAWRAAGGPFDEIYHFAGVNGTRTFYEMPDKVLRVNLLTTIHLLDYALAVGRPRVLFASSSEVYAGTVSLGLAPLPTPEDIPLTVADACNPRNSYGGSKIAGELLCLAYARRAGLDVRIVRYHNVYGPRMGCDHVIPQFCLRIAHCEDPFVIQGAGEMRAFCFIADAVEASRAVMGAVAARGKIIHLGDAREEIRMDDLARRLFALTGFWPEIREVPGLPGSVARRCPDVAKLKALTGFEAQVGLAEGLRRTFAWYAAHAGAAQTTV